MSSQMYNKMDINFIVNKNTATVQNVPQSQDIKMFAASNNIHSDDAMDVETHESNDSKFRLINTMLDSFVQASDSEVDMSDSDIVVANPEIEISDNNNNLAQNMDFDMTNTNNSEVNNNNKDIEMSDDEDNYCPSEFGVSDTEEFDSDPSWEDNSTFLPEEALLKKSTERPLLDWNHFRRLPIEILQQIFGYLVPTQYVEVSRKRSCRRGRDPLLEQWIHAHQQFMHMPGFQNVPTILGVMAGPATMQAGPIVALGTTFNMPVMPVQPPQPVPTAMPATISIQAPTTNTTLPQFAGTTSIFRHAPSTIPSRRCRELRCNCAKEGAAYRDDHSLTAPQMLRVSKAANAALTEIYFGKCAFPAFIDFRPESTTNPDPVLRWNGVHIVPGKEYPLSFDCVRELDLYIQLTMDNTKDECIRKLKRGVEYLARIFAPGKAPRKLKKLTLKVMVDSGVYAELGGIRWDHVSPVNLVGGIKELIEPFYVFSGKENGGERSIHEVELEWPELEVKRKMEVVKEVLEEESDMEVKKTVEVDVDADKGDGWMRNVGEELNFWDNPQTYDMFLIWNWRN